MPSNDNQVANVPWWGWIVAVFAGFFLVNAIPHTVMGITGQEFPTLISGMDAKSTAVTNVLYGSANLTIGIGLLRLIAPHKRTPIIKLVIAISGIAFATLLAGAFANMA